MALTIPNTFVANTAAAADDVNENFDAIETYVNASLATLTNLAALPEGFKAMATLTANSAVFTTIADISSYTVTFTGEANRRYKLSLHAHLSSSVAGDFARLAITTSGDVVQVDSKTELPVINEEQSVDCFVVVTPGAGAVTYKVRGERLSGTGNIMVEASATSPAILLVEDIGPT